MSSCSEMKKNGSFRSHQLCKSEWTNRSNSSNKDFLKRVLEAVYLGDWELEKLFNIADKWNQTNLGKFHQPKKKWAKAIVAIESTVQGIFLKWLFSFLCIFRSNIKVNVYDHFSLQPTDTLPTGYWQVANRVVTVGWQSAKTLAWNIMKTAGQLWVDCQPTVSLQLANSIFRELFFTFTKKT